MTNIATTQTNGQTAAVTHLHPAIIQTGGKLEKAAKRVDARHKTGALAVGHEIATAGVCIDIENILDLAGYFDKNRPQPMTVLQFAKLVLRVWPNIIPAALNKSRFGELSEAYNESLAGSVKNIDMKGWGNGANAEMFVSLATAYKVHQSMPELEVKQAIIAYIPPADPAKVYREAVSHRVDALAAIIAVLPALDAENAVKRGDLPPVLAFGLGYDVMLAAGLISPSKEERNNAFAYAESLIKSEAASKTREKEGRQGAAYKGGLFDAIIAAYQKDAKAAVISTAKDMLFLAALNDEKFDRLQAIAELKKNKAAIVEKETERLLDAAK